MKFLKTMHEMKSFLTFTTLNFRIFLAHDTSPWQNRLWIMSHSIHSHRVWYPSAWSWSIQRIGHYGRDEEELKTHHGQQEKKLQARDSERAAPRGTARCEGLYLSGHPHSSAGSTPTPCGALGGHSEESWPWLSSCLHPRCPLPCLLRPYLLHNSQDNAQDTRQHLQVIKRPALQILMFVSSTAGCV